MIELWDEQPCGQQTQVQSSDSVLRHDDLFVPLVWCHKPLQNRPNLLEDQMQSPGVPTTLYLRDDSPQHGKTAALGPSPPAPVRFNFSRFNARFLEAWWASESICR